MNLQPDLDPLAPELDERLYEILGEWDELRQRGRSTDVAAHFHADPLLAPHPELLAELMRRRAAFQRFAALAEEEPLPHIPGLELLDRLGYGGMGIVYRAWDPSLARIVAVKVVRGGRFAHPDQRRRFQREARKLAALDHPHVIKVYGSGDVDDQSYFVMEFQPGGDLKTKWAGARQPPREAAELVETLARGMHAAHRAGIIHRDLKPSNILLATDGTPKIADFGLAKDLNDEAGLTRTADLMGTEAYMSPEQFQRGAVDARTDVYGLGGILYEALTGGPPFSPGGDVPLSDQIRHQPPEPPRGVAPIVDLDLQTICLKCLEKDPGQRYATAEALADDLLRWLEGDPILARPPGAAQLLARWCRRHPWWSAGAAALLVFVPLVLIVLTVATVRITAARNVALELKSQSDDSAELARERQQVAEARRYQLQLRTAVEALEQGRLSDVAASLEDDMEWEGRRIKLQAQLRAPYVVRRLYEHRWGVLDAIRSRDGQRLITAGADGMLLVWDLQSGFVEKRLLEGRWSKERRRHLHYVEGWDSGTAWPPPIICAAGVCWLEGERSIAVASLDGRALCFDVESGAQTLLHRGDSPLLCAASQPQGGLILFGAEDGSACLIEAGASSQATARFSSAVVAAQWFEAGRCWIIGCRQGELLMLDERTLAVHARLGLEAPLWGFQVCLPAHGDLLAVAVQQPRLATFQLSASPRGFNLASSIEVPRGSSPVTGIHSVCFGASADDVYALDDVGRLVCWDRSRGLVRWIQQVLSNEQLLRTVEHRADAHGWTLPACLKKSGVVVAGWSQPEQIVTATRDMTALVWRTSTLDGKRRITTQTRSRVCFDPQHSDVLWALAEDGHLRAYNAGSATPELLDSIQAHSGGAALVSMPSSGSLLTAGHEGAIRSWRIEAKRIVRGPLHWKHSHRLRSLAACPRGEWVAAVDDRSRLTVWPARGGPPAYSTTLSDENSPLTGCLAFNADGSKLAACGAGQSCSVFTTTPFQRLPERPQLAGGGGVAIAWHPRDPDCLIAADNYPRYEAMPREPRTIQSLGLSLRPHVCRGIVAQTGGRRWFLLEESGEVLVCDTDGTGLLWSFPTSGGPGFDLAIDGRGQRLAISLKSGEIQIVDSVLPEVAGAAKVAQAASSAWREAPLLVDYSGHLAWTSRGVAIDKHDRIHLLAQRPAQHNPSLLYVGPTDEGRIVQEIVDLHGPEHEEALRLALEKEQPVAVYRSRDPQGALDGAKLRVARRTAADTWTSEDLAGPGNLAYFPAARMEDGCLQEVLHFSFSGYYLLRSHRTAEGWQTQQIGHQGDGFNIQCRSSAALPLRFGFRVNRFNGDRAPPMFATWNGRELEREVIDPSCEGLQTIAVRDGSPLVAALLLDRKIPRRRYMVGVRNAAGKWESVAFPGEPIRADARVDRRGHVHVLTMSASGELVLWDWNDKAWCHELIATSDLKKLINVTLLADSHDRSIAVVGLGSTGPDAVSSISAWRRSP